MLCANKECNQGNFGKRKRFEPVRGEKVCCIECSLAVIRSKTYVRKHEKEIRLSNAIEKKKILEKLETHSDWLKKLQKVFNAYIRHRDKDKPCISCDTIKSDAWHASHYYPTTKSFLRFNEDNVHKSCVKCNVFLHGNLVQYRERLIEKIGIERVMILDETKNNKLDLTIPEIKDLIELYKQKIKK